MTDASQARAANEYWGREGLAQAILDALSASGKNLDALTIDDLATLDQFHGGGKAATQRLARSAELEPGRQVLDVGGGIGGPARTLVVEFGCQVTLVDPTESYVQTSETLTERLGLADRLTHRIGSALDLPFEDGSFDVVWTQNSGMNIEDKERLYAELYRVLRPDGRLATQEPMAGPVQPPIFPLMWARDASTSFVRSPAEMRAIMVAAGFRVRRWQEMPTMPAAAAASAPTQTVQRLVVGDALDAIQRAGQRNADEQRLVSVQAVFERM